MNAALLRVTDILRKGDYRSAAGPVLIILILAMMVLPLPPFILDLLFTFNIALSIIVLLISMHTLKPLDFSSFPSILLITTLMRLSLNVASTRVVLMEGHTGPDAAGKVIEAFGHFLVGGNYTVGIVLFVILVSINFMVISKGAGRIAEVSARFTLDAMPGKQMAIDADLNAGLIREDEARRRRTEIAQEAEFFGSMDGASKFVRGDSVAGIAILLINIVGGLAVGVLQHGMDVGHAATNYTLLTIGDGLVAQIPALVISTAAGIMVSRVSTDKDVGQQLSSELFAMPTVLMTTAGVLGLLGLVPGMPHFPFILFGGGLGYLGWYLKKKREVPEIEPVLQAIAPVDTPEASWDDVSWVDVLGLEIGYRLIPLVDKSQDGELLRRIKGIRKKFTQRRWCISATTWSWAHRRTASRSRAWRSATARCSRASSWPSIRAARMAWAVMAAWVASVVDWARNCPARPPWTRPLACRPCGSPPMCAIARRPRATPWSIAAPSSPPTSIS
jgi:flagellar biosynthesis protein FlhA